VDAEVGAGRLHPGAEGGRLSLVCEATLVCELRKTTLRGGAPGLEVVARRREERLEMSAGGVVAPAVAIEERQIPVGLRSVRLLPQQAPQHDRGAGVLTALQVRDGTAHQAPRARLLAAGRAGERSVRGPDGPVPQLPELGPLSTRVAGLGRRGRGVVCDVGDALVVDPDEGLGMDRNSSGGPQNEQEREGLAHVRLFGGARDALDGPARGTQRLEPARRGGCGE
jgi:hypothetical protein